MRSQAVYTDGAEVIYDCARDSDDDALLTVVRTGQQHLAEVIRAYLKPVTYGEDGWVQRMRLPTYAGANVVVDPHQAFGQPVVIDGGARMEDVFGSPVVVQPAQSPAASRPSRRQWAHNPFSASADLKPLSSAP